MPIHPAETPMHIITTPVLRTHAQVQEAVGRCEGCDGTGEITFGYAAEIGGITGPYDYAECPACEGSTVPLCWICQGCGATKATDEELPVRWDNAADERFCAACVDAEREMAR